MAALKKFDVNGSKVEYLDYDHTYGNPNFMDKTKYISNEIEVMKHYGMTPEHIEMRTNILEYYVTDEVVFCTDDEMDALLAAKDQLSKKLETDQNNQQLIQKLNNLEESLVEIAKITKLFNYVKNNMETCSLMFMSDHIDQKGREIKSPMYHHATETSASMKDKDGKTVLLFGQVYWTLRQFALSKWGAGRCNYSIQSPVKANYKLVSKDVCFLMGQKFFCIDIDVAIDHKQTKILLNSFPNDFGHTLSESTKKGLHYYFKKTDKLLELGSIDGARSLSINEEDNARYGFEYQILESGNKSIHIEYIDIKSCTGTHTRGLVKCWPSSGRTLRDNKDLDELDIKTPSKELEDFLLMTINTSRNVKLSSKVSNVLTREDKREFLITTAIVDDDVKIIKDISNDDSKIILFLEDFCSKCETNYSYDDWIKIILAMCHIAGKYVKSADKIYELIHKFSARDSRYKYEETQLKIEDGIKNCNMSGVAVGRNTINEYFKMAAEDYFVKKYEKSYEWVKRRIEYSLIAINGPSSNSYAMLGEKNNDQELFINYKKKYELIDKYENVYCYIPNPKFREESDDSERFLRKQFINLWFADEYRRTVRGVAFVLNEKNLPKGYISSFRGLAVEDIIPKYDDSIMHKIRFIYDHILNVFCSKNNDLFQWVIQWIATILQKTGIASGTILVLQDFKGGSGKSMFADFMRELIGKNHSSTDNPSGFFGTFNNQAHEKLMCVIEEGAKTGRDALCNYIDRIKAFTTSDRIQVEYKGANRFEDNNYANLLILTNYQNIFAQNSNTGQSSAINDRREVWLICDETFVIDKIANGSESKRAEYYTTLASYMKDPQVQRAFYDEVCKVKLWSDIENNKMALLAHRPVDQKQELAKFLNRSPYDMSFCNFITDFYNKAQNRIYFSQDGALQISEITNKNQLNAWHKCIANMGRKIPSGNCNLWIIIRASEFIMKMVEFMNLDENLIKTIKREDNLTFIQKRVPHLAVGMSNRSNIIHFCFSVESILEYLKRPENDVKPVVYDEDNVNDNQNFEDQKQDFNNLQVPIKINMLDGMQFFGRPSDEELKELSKIQDSISNRNYYTKEINRSNVLKRVDRSTAQFLLDNMSDKDLNSNRARVYEYISGVFRDDLEFEKICNKMSSLDWGEIVRDLEVE